jgi:hypothetical protein
MLSVVGSHCEYESSTNTRDLKIQNGALLENGSKDFHQISDIYGDHFLN